MPVAKLLNTQCKHKTAKKQMYYGNDCSLT